MQKHSAFNSPNHSSVDYIRSTSCGSNSLPTNFTPNPYTVICGRGQIFYNSVGNCRFRQIIKMHLQRYNETDDKHSKSLIVTEVIDMIHSAGGQFVKQVNRTKNSGSEARSSWRLVSNSAMREKVSSAFRDQLHDKYSSAAKNKNARRLAKVKQQRIEEGERIFNELSTRLSSLRASATSTTERTKNSISAPAPESIKSYVCAQPLDTHITSPWDTINKSAFDSLDEHLGNALGGQDHDDSSEADVLESFCVDGVFSASDSEPTRL